MREHTGSMHSDVKQAQLLTPCKHLTALSIPLLCRSHGLLHVLYTPIQERHAVNVDHPAEFG